MKEEFLVWTVDNAYPAEFSRLVFHLCHVVLGLRPLTRRDEADVVRGWMSREESAPLSVGSVWHLVNAEWWRSWNTYVEHALLNDNGGGGSLSNSPRVGGSAPGSASSSLSSDFVIQQGGHSDLRTTLLINKTSRKYYKVY